MDLTTHYLGFALPHPFLPGASPLADTVDGVRHLEDAGAPMIILRSLFEEQIVGEQMAAYHATETLAESFGEASSFLAEPDTAVFGPHEYLRHLTRVKEAVSVPVVASLNGTSRGGWLGYAQLIEQAGADALELNVYELATDPDRSGESLERETIDMIRQLRRGLRIPVAVKLSPFHTAFAHFAKQVDDLGVAGLVIFNRFYQPDIDIHALDTFPLLRLSSSTELLLRLRWLAILWKRVQADLAVTGGVHEPEDAIKALMCGATAVQCVSALLERGPSHLRVLKAGLDRFMEEEGYESLAQLRGNMSLATCPDPHAFERTNYMQVLQSWRV